MKEPHTKHQHYVPRFLLKNFSLDGRQVTVWDRKIHKIFKTNVKSICCFDDLYEVKWKNSASILGKYVLDNKLEKEFSNSEYEASIVIKNIIKEASELKRRIVLDQVEKRIVYEFATMLYLRNPAKMDEIRNYYDGVEAEPGFSLIRQGTEIIFERWGWGSPKSVFEYSIKSMIFSKELEGSPYKVEFERMAELKYVFWRSKKEMFVTSSFPMHIVSFDKENYDRIIIPLNSTLSLVFFRGDYLGLEEGMILDPEDSVIEYNMKWFMKTYSVEHARFFIAKNEKTLKKLI